MNRVDTSDEFRRSGRSVISNDPRVSEPVPDAIAHLDFLEAHTSVVPPADIVALCGRQNSGLSVQLLTTTGEDVRAWITLDVNGRTETFEVEPSKALDAYQHPYAYGATLPL